MELYMHRFRQAKFKDINKIAEIEKKCFLKEEGASLESFKERFAIFSECFFVIEVAGNIVGHINGCIYDTPELPDELYSDPSLHCSNGKYQTVFGLAVDPDFQGNGYASLLCKHFIEVSKTRQHKGIVLTCKDHLIKFYQDLGFKHIGKSDSNHGGASWNDMLLIF